MKKFILGFLIALFAVLGLKAVLTTHVPIEAYWPKRPEEPGYKEHTQAHEHFLGGFERKGDAALEYAAYQGYAPAQRKLADIYLHRKNMPRLALKYYTLAADQGDVIAMKSLADLYYEDKNFSKALEYYEKLAPQYPSIWQRIAELHSKLGNTKKAAEAFTKFDEVHTHYHWHR
ncbi:MAG: hypothetical protein AB7R69_06000 [Candidatus Babeliales bacterium]